jgi:KRAB domain-containing zinc finger protein
MARHNEQKLYQCDVCQKGFNLINDLKRHKFNIHNDVLDLKLYSCNECPASFIKKATLLNHIAMHLESKKSILVNLKKENPVKIKQKQKKTYKCQECGLTCNSRINHKIHIARHQKKPLYFCDFCSWGCYLKNDLSRHIISKHVDHAGEVFGHSCKSCNAIFPRKKQLLNHEKKHQISLSDFSSKAVGP